MLSNCSLNICVYIYWSSQSESICFGRGEHPMQRWITNLRPENKLVPSPKSTSLLHNVQGRWHKRRLKECKSQRIASMLSNAVFQIRHSYCTHELPHLMPCRKPAQDRFSLNSDLCGGGALQVPPLTQELLTSDNLTTVLGRRIIL